VLPPKEATKYHNEKNLLTYITIRELYKAYCNEKLNQTLKVKNIRKNLTLTLEVALSRGTWAVKTLELGGKWIKSSSRSKYRTRKNTSNKNLNNM